MIRGETPRACFAAGQAVIDYVKRISPGSSLGLLAASTALVVQSSNSILVNRDTAAATAALGALCSDPWY